MKSRRVIGEHILAYTTPPSAPPECEEHPPPSYYETILADIEEEFPEPVKETTYKEIKLEDETGGCAIL